MLINNTIALKGQAPESFVHDTVRLPFQAILISSAFLSIA